jgi:hypothetical protein
LGRARLVISVPGVRWTRTGRTTKEPPIPPLTIVVVLDNVVDGKLESRGAALNRFIGGKSDVPSVGT